MTYVGQRVVCIRKGNWIGSSGSRTRGPILGSVCEIENIVLHDDDGEYLILREYPHLGVSGKRLSFPGSAFKPLDEYKSDISVFDSALFGDIKDMTWRLDLLLSERNPLDYKRKRTR